MSRLSRPSRPSAFGSFREAAIAGPPSPERPAVPLPATVRMVLVRISMFTASSETSHDGITHFCRPNDTHARALNILRPIPEIQRFDDRLLDQLCLLVELEGIRQHHG